MKTRIRELRKSKNLTQTALSMAIGCSQNTISKIELETAIPNADVLCKIADYFHTSVDYLLYRSDERYPSHKISPNMRFTQYFSKLQTLSPKGQGLIFAFIDYITNLDNEE